VVQRDEVNASTLNSVVVCALTSNTRLAGAPGNTLLPTRVTHLPRPTVANASQIATLDKADLVQRVSSLPPEVMSEVEDGLRWFLGLDLL
jgi:mRNA interferase MazF